MENLDNYAAHHLLVGEQDRQFSMCDRVLSYAGMTAMRIAGKQASNGHSHGVVPEFILNASAGGLLAVVGFCAHVGLPSLE